MSVRKWACALSSAVLLGASLQGCSPSAETEAAAPAPPVTVAQPLRQQMVDWDEYVGRFEATERVEVTPRASGYLQAVHFRDGQFVRKGQLLFTIDSRPAQAQLDQARAQLARAEATLANARTELARSRTLAQSRAASEEEVEARQAALRSAEADLAAARAAVRAQQLNVGFTRVVAPISGRISERRVDPGNSVTADQSVLTTIVSTDPLHFAFEGSEASLLKYQRQGTGGPGTPVRIRLQDEAEFSHGGQLDFIDNAVRTGSGTIRARALVRNPAGFLRPGMIGRVRLAASATYQALLVPDAAIVTDAARRLVYLVDGEGKVIARPVQLGPLNGSLRVVRAGLSPQDRVIINGLQRARPGQQVQPTSGRIEAASGARQEAPESSATPAAVALPADASGGAR